MSSKVNVTKEQALRHLSNVGISAFRYAESESELLSKWQRSPSPMDVLIHIFSQDRMATSKKGDWQRYGLLSFEEARIRFEAGLDSLQLQREAAKGQILSHRPHLGDSGFVEVLTAEDPCPSCAALRGQRFSLKDALATMPLPPTNCANRWCRCEWLPVLGEDKPATRPLQQEAAPKHSFFFWFGLSMYALFTLIYIAAIIDLLHEEAYRFLILEGIVMVPILFFSGRWFWRKLFCPKVNG